MEHVGEVEGFGAAAGNRSGGQVEHGVEGYEAVEVGEHCVDGGEIGIRLGFEKHDVFDDLFLIGG